MRRVRWLGARWPVSIRTLANRMKEGHLFTPDSFDGFVIDRVRDDFLEAHYVEKMVYRETVTDPFGKESVYERTGYRQLDFSLFSSFPNIELRDAHRGTKELVSKLLELCSFSLTIEPISVSVLAWAAAFEAASEKDVMVDSLQVSGVELDSGVSAKILLKGELDVRPSLGQFPNPDSLEVERLQMRVPYDRRGVALQLTDAGAAKVPEDYWEELRPLLRSSLATVASRDT